MNGGNWDHDYNEKYQPTITSYGESCLSCNPHTHNTQHTHTHTHTHNIDYDAPVSECGDLTEKFNIIREVISKYAPDSMCKF